MIKKLLIIIVLISVFHLSITANNDSENIYSGGMLLFQPGLTFTENSKQNIEDFSFGLGGILRFYIYDYFTVGIFGGTNRTNYLTEGSDNSYINLGYGGPFIGFTYSNKFRYTASFFIGRGTVNNLHVEETTKDYQLQDSYYYSYPAMVVSPILSFDVPISERLLITTQAVCLIAYYAENTVMLNPILQIGLLFNR